MRNFKQTPGGIHLPDTRLDADDTVFFLRQLESIDQRPYEVLFASMLGRRFIPLQDGVDPTANVYTYRMFEMTGQAKVSGPNANDLPKVGVRGAERSQNIKQIEVSYGWLVREIQQAAKTGTPLDQMTVRAAQNSVARQVDNILAFGYAPAQIPGIFNIPNVVSSTAVTKTTGGVEWAANTPPDELLADLNLIVADTRNALKQAGDDAPIFPRFTILLPSTNYSIAATTPRSTTSDTTILKYAIQNNPWIESIEEWWQADTADGSGGPRAVCFPRDPLAVAALIPSEFTALAPQAVGLGYDIPAYGSCGGVVCRYAVAVRYMNLS